MAQSQEDPTNAIISVAEAGLTLDLKFICL